MISEIAGYLDKIEINYMNHHVLHRTATNAAKLYRKLFDSLSYFRRSFKSRGDEDEQVTNLAIAFEVLITTEYASGVGKRFERRIALALSLHPDSKRLTTATKNLYKVRSELVHQGTTETEYDLAQAQEAFGQIFSQLCGRWIKSPKPHKTLSVFSSVTRPLSRLALSFFKVCTRFPLYSSSA